MNERRARTGDCHRWAGAFAVALFLCVTADASASLAEDSDKDDANGGEEAWKEVNESDAGPKAEAKLEYEDATEENEERLFEDEYKNAFIFGFSHILHLTRDRGTELGSAIGHRENLLGPFFAFERILHPHVSITFVKPFYFNKDRLDSPFELLINGLYRVNDWEPFVAAGMLSVLRVFYAERDANGVAEKEFSFGLRFVAGFKYFITPRWAVTFEFGYTFIPANDVIEHEISDSYLGAYFF